MTLSTLEPLAKRNAPMPENLHLYEQEFFQATACLTTRYRLGGIDAEEAKTEMGQIRQAFTEAQREAETRYEQWGIIQAFHAGTMAVLRDYALNPCRETADRLYRVCGGLEKGAPIETDNDHNHPGPVPVPALDGGSGQALDGQTNSGA